MIYLNCSMGASGDMLVSALYDLYKDSNAIQKMISDYGCSPEILNIENVKLNAISCSKLSFNIDQNLHFDTFKDIKMKISLLSFSENIKKKILLVYEIIFKAESIVHGKDIKDLHLHELGSLETLFEISAFFILLSDEKLYSSTLPLGRGCINAAHGTIPIPSPVTAEILKSVPVKFVDSSTEMITPTAAAILKSCAEFSKHEYKIANIGYGAGARSILRAFQVNTTSSAMNETLLQMEFNIDDMTPEDQAFLMETLRPKAVDAVLIPVLMKKGRPGSLISLICREEQLETLKQLIYQYSSTLGFRYWPISRDVLTRETVSFKSSYGMCKLKKTLLPSGESLIKPEYDDLVKIVANNPVSVNVLRNKIIQEYNNNE